MFWTVVGASAALLTSTGFLPQIVKGIQTRRLKDVSALMMTTWVLGTMLWFFYGWHLGDWIIMAANVFTCACGVLILAMKYRFDREATEGEEPARAMMETK